MYQWMFEKFMTALHCFLMLNQKKLCCHAMMMLLTDTIGHVSSSLAMVLLNTKFPVLHEWEKNRDIIPPIGNANHIVALDLAHVPLMEQPAYKMKKILLNIC